MLIHVFFFLQVVSIRFWILILIMFRVSLGTLWESLSLHLVQIELAGFMSTSHLKQKEMKE